MDQIKGLKERVVKNDFKVFDLVIGRIKLLFIEMGKIIGGVGWGQGIRIRNLIFEKVKLGMFVNQLSVVVEQIVL